MWESFDQYLNTKMKKLLPRPFIYWRSFMLGLIDKDGNLLRKPKGKTELQVHDVFTELIRKFKRTMELYIPSKGLLRHKVYKDFLSKNSNINKVIEELNLNHNTEAILEENNDKIEKLVVEYLNEN